jgi:hypothetical protein
VLRKTASGALLSLEALEDRGGTSLGDLQVQILASIEGPSLYLESLRRRGLTTLQVARHETRWSLVTLPSVYRLDDVPRVTAAQPGVSALSYTVTLDQSKKLLSSEASKMLSPFGIRLNPSSR